MKKKNLTREFLNSLPVDVRLPFGIATNVRVTKIFNGDVFNRNSEKINKNCFITFSQFDAEEKDKIVAEGTYGYWNMSRHEFAYGSFIHQMVQLGQILKHSVPKDKSEELTKEFETFIDTECTNIMDIFDKGAVKEDLPAIQKGMASIAGKAEELIAPFYKTGELIQFIVACDKSGEFLELPGREAKGFIDHADSEALTLPNKYKAWRKNKDIPKKDTPDAIGDTNAVMDEETIIEEEEEEIAMDI